MSQSIRVPPARRLPLPAALATALVLEAGLVGGLAWHLAPRAQTTPEPPVVMQVSHVALPAAEDHPRQAPKPSDPPLPKPATDIQAEPPKPVPPPRPAPDKQRPAPKQAAPAISPPAALPTVEPVLETPPAVTQAAAPPPISTDTAPGPVQEQESVRFETLLRAAVQEAARFPAAARAMGRQGRVRVGFDFEDGRVSAVKVVSSADFDAFDEAAMTAVAEARYPTPPAHLQRKLLHLTVWVEFLKKGY